MRGWLSRWLRRAGSGGGGVEPAAPIFLLRDLSARGFSIANGRVPWAPGDRVRVRIRASEGAEISLWTVVRSRRKSGAELEFVPHLPETEIPATAAELRQAVSIVLAGRDEERAATY